GSQQEAKKAGARLQKLQKQFTLAESIEKTHADLKALEEMRSGMTKTDYESEITELHQAKNEAENQLQKLEAGEAEDLPQNIILEIRAGAGGDEASLFAAELFNMYS